MVWFIGLVIAATLALALYLVSQKPLWKRRAFEKSLDAEQSVALMKPSASSAKQNNSNIRSPTLPYSAHRPDLLLEKDQQAASAQLLDEFAASTASNTLQNSEIGEPPETLPDTSFYVKVNPKQYRRILKRRLFRQDFEESLRKAQMAKNQGRSSRRSKVPDGMMMALG